MKPNDGQFDQDLASMRDGLPRIWWSIYQGNLMAGFTKDQAYGLLQSFIIAQSVKSVYPLPPNEEPKDNG